MIQMVGVNWPLVELGLLLQHDPSHPRVAELINQPWTEVQARRMHAACRRAVRKLSARRCLEYRDVLQVALMAIGDETQGRALDALQCDLTAKVAAWVGAALDGIGQDLGVVAIAPEAILPPHLAHTVVDQDDDTIRDRLESLPADQWVAMAAPTLTPQQARVLPALVEAVTALPTAFVLPSTQVLADASGVPRTTVRDTLHMLERRRSVRTIDYPGDDVLPAEMSGWLRLVELHWQEGGTWYVATRPNPFTELDRARLRKKFSSRRIADFDRALCLATQTLSPVHDDYDGWSAVGYARSHVG